MKNTTMTDPDDLLRRLEDADTEELHGYASVKLGELLGEAAAAIVALTERVAELDQLRRDQVSSMLETERALDAKVARLTQERDNDQSGEVANGELGMSSVPGREARDNLSVRANAAAVPTSPDPDDRLLRRRDAMADDVNAWHQAIREAFREDAAEIRRLRAERAEALSSSAHLAKMYDAAVAALRELVNAHGKAGVSGPGPEMKTAVGWALDKARKIVEGK